MQGINRGISLVLAAFVITSTCFCQNISWLKGSWYGKAYLPGSDVTQSYMLILRIYAIKDNKFEGIISAVQPSDTSIRFDTQIAGIVYDNYLLMHKGRILYVKDGPHVRWKVSCNNCKPPRMSLSLENGKIIFKGEQSDCYKECLGINEFAKNVDDLDSSGKKSLYALLHIEENKSGNEVLVKNDPGTGTEQPGNPVTFQRLNLPPSGAIVQTAGVKTPAQTAIVSVASFRLPSGFTVRGTPTTKKIVVSGADTIAGIAANVAWRQPPAPPALLRRSPRVVTPVENIWYKRIVVSPSDTLMLLRAVAFGSSGKKMQLNRVMPSLTLLESNVPALRISISRADSIITVQTEKSIAYINRPALRPGRGAAAFTFDHIPLAPKILLMPSDTVVLARRKNTVTTVQRPSLIKSLSTGILPETAPVTRKIVVSADDRIAAIFTSPMNRSQQPVTAKLFRRISLTVNKPVVTDAQNRRPSTNDSISFAVNKPVDATSLATALKRDSVALLPAGYAERKKTLIRTITVNTDSVVLRVYDNGVVDGDIVSVVYNDKVVIDKLSLTSHAVEVRIPVMVAGTNTLVFHAHNLGEFPPNTAKLEIIYGNKKEELTVSSDMTVSSTIDIVHE